MGALGALGLFASVLLHELSHALVARRRGARIRGITLFIFGGVAEMEDEPPSPSAEFAVAIVGPLTSVVIGGVCLGLAWLSGQLNLGAPTAGVLGYLGWINLVLAAFNLVPAFPLDGGRVLRAALWRWKNSLRRATRITAGIGSGFGLALIVLGVLTLIAGNLIGGLWWILIGLFLRSAAQMSYRQVLIRRVLEGEPVSRFMTPDPRTVPPAASVRELVEDYVYRYHHKMFPVAENGALLGCVSTRQIQEIPRSEWEQRRVGEVARPCGRDNVVRPGDDALQALEKMQRHRVSRLLVVADGHLAGIVALKDLLRFIALKLELEPEGEGVQPGRASDRAAPAPQRPGRIA
jgi:Zn-dependent protease